MAVSENSNTRAFETSRAIAFFKGINRIFTRCYHHVEVLSPPQIPKSGSAILISNHISGLDPLVIQSALNRPVAWMMAREYYEIGGLRWLFELIEAIPVERSGKDLAAMRAALRALESGRVLGVFPEGRIEVSRDLLPFQTGVALMAVKTDAPVYCCAVEGTSRGREMRQAFSKRCDVKLTFGPEVQIDRSLSTRENLQRVTSSLEAEVGSLRRKLDKKIGL